MENQLESQVHYVTVSSDLQKNFSDLKEILIKNQGVSIAKLDEAQKRKERLDTSLQEMMENFDSLVSNLSFDAGEDAKANIVSNLIRSFGIDYVKAQENVLSESESSDEITNSIEFLKSLTPKE